jgi:hypothetical protein
MTTLGLRALLGLCGAALAGCAGVPGTGLPPGAAMAPTAAASAPAPRSVPAGQPPAFDAVVKDATRLDGAFAVWVQKDGKAWIELAEDDFDAPLFLSPKLATGIGEAGLYGGLMNSPRAEVGRPQWVSFRKVHQQVQLVARNARFVAQAGTPQARAVQAAYSDSLIGSAPLASQPHPQRKTVLVELNPLLLGDWPGFGPHLQRVFRQGYSFDARNSALQRVRVKPEVAVFEVLAHYATASLAAAPAGLPASAPAPRTPSTLPDPRSLFLTLHYSLSRLPAEPMAPRAADPRIGHFNTVVNDFGDDLARSPKRRFIHRWRLEKQDPAAPLSPPVKPIVYWVDRSVPLKYRASITAGILEWNKAFEAIGWQGAIVVQQQPDDADFDTLDTGVNAVRWMTNADPGFGAIGPTHTDPRSGEILDADIALESLSSRAMRTLRSQVLEGRDSANWWRLMQAGDALREQGLQDTHDLQACEVLDQAGEQLGYALDVLAARGDLDPASPEAERYVQAYLKDVTMHEVGHTLGLRHNFRASRIYPNGRVAAAADPSTPTSLAGSVMEYLPVNLPQPGAPTPVPFQSTLGPYDYWAIEYAYRPLEGDAAAQARALQAIAARSGEPSLAFATDEDQVLGIDPEGLSFDLGDDPIAFATTRAEIARDLLRRLGERPLDPSHDYAGLRRTVRFALRDLARATGIVTRQIGGVRTLRDYPNTGRDPLQVLPAAQQRAALAWLVDNVLDPRGLSVPPALQRRLAPDFLERGDALNANDDPGDTDFNPDQLVFDIQRALLVQLTSEGLARRLVDAPAKAPADAGSLSFDELVQRLDRAVWHPGAPTPLRRALQREHAARIAQLLLKPPAGGRTEVRDVWRAQARDLLARLERETRSTGDATQRRHLADCAAVLRDALEARVQRNAS